MVSEKDIEKKINASDLRRRFNFKEEIYRKLR